MPFAGQLPGIVLEIASSGNSVLEVFCRNLFVNMDTGEVYLRSGDRSPVRTWPAKRGDKVPVQIRFVNEELDGTSELIKLPVGTAIRFEAHRRNADGSCDYSALMVQQNVWSAEDLETDPHYDATVSFDEVALNSAIGKGGTELPYVDIECDIEVWKGTDRLSSANMTIRVYNDHSRGEADVPDVLGFIGSGYQFAWWITGLVGGLNTDLDGQPTIHLAYGETVVRVDVGGPPSEYKYVEDPEPGVTVCDGVNLIKPTDYNAATNDGLWALKE